nr:ferrous iron transport protein B [Succinivibrionaceae bacterium]
LREAFRNQSGDIRIAQTGLPDCCKPEAKVDPRVLAAQSPEDSFFVVDLPGLYSLSPYSAEEVVSREYLLSNDYDVIVNVVDATHLERTLSLTMEVLPLGRPMVVAVNMMDEAEKQGLKLDITKMQELLGVRCVPIVASSQAGLVELFSAIENAEAPEQAEIYDERAAAAVRRVADLIKDDSPLPNRRFTATQLIQNDKIYLERYKGIPDLESEVARAQAEILDVSGQDPETYFAASRYAALDRVVGAAVQKGGKLRQSISQQVDNLVLNRFLAFPIFLFMVWLVYYISVSTIGTWGTDYANDVIFGEWCMDGADAAFAAIGGAPEWLESLVKDGIIGGVGAVLGFVPQMIVLFFLLSFLEQCGYMTRAAFALDRLFRMFGMSGKSFIPLIVASGCGVPALMATKTVDNINERRIGLIATTFVPCSAKFPIIVMVLAAFYPDSTLVAPGIYLTAIAAVALTGIILKKSRSFHEEVSPFVMEMPDYHLPTLRNLLRSTYLRCKAFVIKAGTVIFTVVVAVWFLSSFGVGEDSIFAQVDIEQSYLCYIGTAIAFIFAPLGFATWQASVAVFTGLLAKENVVGTMATLLGVEAEEGDEQVLSEALQGHFEIPLMAFSYLLFNLFSTPCVAALGAMKRQLGSTSWFTFAIVYQLLFAYVLSLLCYQLVGLMMGVVSFSIFTVFALAALAGVLYLVFRREQREVVSIKIPVRNV